TDHYGLFVYFYAVNFPYKITNLMLVIIYNLNMFSLVQQIFLFSFHIVLELTIVLVYLHFHARLCVLSLWY
ncbi:hypothetical protein ACJX0J_033729, partial [Zea mays]